MASRPQSPVKKPSVTRKPRKRSKPNPTPPATPTDAIPANLPRPELKREKSHVLPMKMAVEVKKIQPLVAKEGFSTLAKWTEHKFSDVVKMAPGTWLSYTRDASFLPKEQYEALQQQAIEQKLSLQELIDATPKKRKKTVCKIIGYDDETERLRVESIPLTGQRASQVFPNRTHSWDIPAHWRGNPRFYIISPEYDPKTAKRPSRKRSVKKTAKENVPPPQDVSEPMEM